MTVIHSFRGGALSGASEQATCACIPGRIICCLRDLTHVPGPLSFSSALKWAAAVSTEPVLVKQAVEPLNSSVSGILHGYAMVGTHHRDVPALTANVTGTNSLSPSALPAKGKKKLLGCFGFLTNEFRN